MGTLGHKRSQLGTKIPLKALLGALRAFVPGSQAEGRRFEPGLVLQIIINPAKCFAWWGCCVWGSPTYWFPRRNGYLDKGLHWLAKKV